MQYWVGEIGPQRSVVILARGGACVCVQKVPGKGGRGGIVFNLRHMLRHEFDYAAHVIEAIFY
jgi:hypothetical protein